MSSSKGRTRTATTFAGLGKTDSTAWQYRWPSGQSLLVPIALLCIFFAQAVTAIPQLSLTADEPVYMGAGYAFLRSGDLRMATSAQHPPLMQELVALPLLLQPGPKLETLAGWHTAEMARYAPAFVAWYGDRLDAATFVVRLPVVWVALLWAVFLFRWTTDWFGPWGGIVALTLFVFDPNILAHATLATNDVGFAVFSFIALFAVMRLVRRPSHSTGPSTTLSRDRPPGRLYSGQAHRYLVLAGLALGASLSAKSSGFFAALVLATLLPLVALVGGKGRVRRIVGAVLRLSFILCLGLLVLWTTYGFELRPLAEEPFADIPIPLATQWEVWREMRGHLARGHTAYLMGEVRDTGWLAYYPLAFALKTPPVTLALLVIGLVAAVAPGPRCWLAKLPLWIYLGGYVAAALLSTVNTGYRFLLPVLPCSFILIAGLFRDGMPWLRSPVLRWGSWAVLVLSGVAVTARLHPDYLTYFNLLAGGPARGHRYLVDSNLDWGQSFKALKAYLDKQGIGQVWLSHYTYADPALYGIHYQPVAPSPGAPPVLPSRFAPAPGVYVISATALQGLMVADPDTYDWFRHREPIGRPGTALFVYQVDPRRDIGKPPGWLAQCTVPVAPLTAEVAEEGFGGDRPPGRLYLRMAYFDCTSAWLYPGGCESPGAFALFRDTARGDNPFIQARLGESTLSYEQRRPGALPSFAIYEQNTLPAFPRLTPDAPIRVGHLTLLGYTKASPLPAQPGQTMELTTWWRVDSLPERPLSIMMHLMEPQGPALSEAEGTPVAVGDGLGVPIENWQAGDVIVQRHLLALPADTPPGEYIPATGVYWLDTMARWSIEREGKPIGDQLALPAILVTARR